MSLSMSLHWETHQMLRSVLGYPVDRAHCHQVHLFLMAENHRYCLAEAGLSRRADRRRFARHVGSHQIYPEIGIHWKTSLPAFAVMCLDPGGYSAVVGVVLYSAVDFVAVYADRN